MRTEAEDVQETMQKAVEWLVSVKGNLQPGLVEWCLWLAGRDRVHYKQSLKEIWEYLQPETFLYDLMKPVTAPRR
jgi:hypothetical protein